MEVVSEEIWNIYFLSLGGARNSKIVSADSSFFSIPDLKESATYNIYVSSIVGNREGSPVLLTAKTCEYSRGVCQSVRFTEQSVYTNKSSTHIHSSHIYSIKP